MRRVLYLQGPSTLLNPTLDQELIDAAYQDDAEAARAEWGGLFRADVSAYLSDAVIDRAIVAGEKSRPRLLDAEHAGFLDAAGGAGSDSMTAAVAHQERGGRVMLDQILAIDPPFDTEQAVERCALLFKSFGISAVKADRYAGDWPTQSFRRHGITVMQCELTKSQIYSEVAPMFVSGLVSLIDDQRLEVELRSLERTPVSGGKPDKIDHAPGRGAHDDRINAVAGALWMASQLPWAGMNPAAPSRGVHLCSADYNPIDPDWHKGMQGYAGRH